MSDTPLLGLPLLAAEQAQKHVIHNEALAALDTIVQLAAGDRDLTSPPASPSEGDRYIAASGSTGEWAGNDFAVAVWQNGAWSFHAPREGWRCWLEDEDALVVFDGADWVEVSPTLIELQNLSLLGIGTTADGTNPFSAKLNKALWTAKTAGEGGDGDLRSTMNKEAAADVLSLLLQSGFSGRAEIGLIGDDDLLIKVSPDGSSWFEGLRIDKDTGQLSFPNGATWSREKLSANRSYYVNSSTGSDSNDGLSAGAPFLTLQKAINVVASIDMGGFEATINVAAGSYASVNLTPLVGGNANIIGDETTPANVTITGASADAINAEGCAGGSWLIAGLKLALSGSGTRYSLKVGAQTYVRFRNIDFAAGLSNGAHIQVQNSGTVEAVGNYSISGGGQVHMWSSNAGQILIQNKTVTLTGAPAFSSAFAYARTCGPMILNGNTYSGAATGKRYDAATNGVINTAGGGANYFPGNSAGSTAQGGQYV